LNLEYNINIFYKLFRGVHHIIIYNYMSGIYKSPRVGVNQYGNNVAPLKQTDEFNYLINLNVNSIINFDNGTDELKDSGAIILPRKYHIFVGTKDYELKFKPYEYDQYRIVVTTYKDIIISIDSLG